MPMVAGQHEKAITLFVEEVCREALIQQLRQLLSVARPRVVKNSLRERHSLLVQFWEVRWSLVLHGGLQVAIRRTIGLSSSRARSLDDHPICDWIEIHRAKRWM